MEFFPGTPIIFIFSNVLEKFTIHIAFNKSIIVFINICYNKYTTILRTRIQTFKGKLHEMSNEHSPDFRESFENLAKTCKMLKHAARM